MQIPMKIPFPNSTPKASEIAKLVLNSTDFKTLTKTLIDPALQWTPNLVDQTLKILWNDAPKALRFFEALDIHHRSYDHSSSSFDHAVDLAARLRDHRTVWTLIKRMRALGVGPNPKTFTIVAERFANYAKPDRTVDLFLKMHEYGCPQTLTSFNTFLDVLCKSKRVEKAHNLLRSFRRKFRVDLISYATIVNGWCLAHNTSKAMQVMEEMVNFGFKPNLICYNIMLKGFLRDGQVKHASDLFIEMKKRLEDEKIDVYTYTTLIHGFGILGDVGKAREIFDEMFSEGVLPSVPTYNALIQVLCKKDSVLNAGLVFEDMVRRGYEPNLKTYVILIHGLCREGSFDRAEEFFRQMRLEGLEPSVQIYNVLIRSFLYCRETEKGLEFFEEMKSGENGICLPNKDTYDVMINGMFVRKRSEDLVIAGKLLIEMIDKGFVPDKALFSRILDGLSMTGNQDFARRILNMQTEFGKLPHQFRFP